MLAYNLYPLADVRGPVLTVANVCPLADARGSVLTVACTGPGNIDPSPLRLLALAVCLR
jgi:hypothetical protein